MARTICNAFLAFCAIILLAAMIALYLAWPTTARAQFLYIAQEIECTSSPILPLEDVIDQFPSARDLSADEFAAYLEAASATIGQSRYVDEGIWARLVEEENGGASVLPVYEGMLCHPWYIGPKAHAAGMEAVNGVPI